MPFFLAEIQSVVNTFRIRIPDRRTFSGHIRKKYNSVTTRRNYFCLFVHQIQRADAPSLSFLSFPVSKFLFQPAHDTAASCSSPLKQPVSRHNMGSEDQPLVCTIMIHADTHPPCLPALLLCLSIVKYTDSQCCAGCIQTACHNRDSHAKSTFFGRFFCHGSDHSMAWIDFRKQIL